MLQETRDRVWQNLNLQLPASSQPRVSQEPLAYPLRPEGHGQAPVPALGERNAHENTPPVVADQHERERLLFQAIPDRLVQAYPEALLQMAVSVANEARFRPVYFLNPTVAAIALRSAIFERPGENHDALALATLRAILTSIVQDSIEEIEF